MKVLVACEESQRVCKAFREKGHEAYSCDIVECSGGHPEWHIKQDVLPLLNGLNCKHLMFSDMYGECNKQLKIVNPSDTCEFAEPKERGGEK